MRIIATLVDMIEDELEGADNYAEKAISWKAKHPKLADKLHELAGVEMLHAKQLHAEITKLIDEVRQRDGEPPESMLALYEYEHKKLIKQAAAVRSMIDEYDQ